MHVWMCFHRMWVCISTHIVVNLWMTVSKGSILVQQDATICRALIQNLVLLIRTPWVCVIGLLTAIEIKARKWWLLFASSSMNTFMHVHDQVGAMLKLLTWGRSPIGRSPSCVQTHWRHWSRCRLALACHRCDCHCSLHTDHTMCPCNCRSPGGAKERVERNSFMGHLFYH